MFALLHRQDGNNNANTLNESLKTPVRESEAGSDRVVNLTDGRKAGTLTTTDQTTQQVARDSKPLVLSLPKTSDASPSYNQDLARQSYIQSLNIQLQQAVRGSDRTLCRYLVEMRADVNAKDQAGITPLQKALLKNNLLICKILIDLGAEVTEADKENIQKALKTCWNNKDIRSFLTKRPNPYTPEV